MRDILSVIVPLVTKERDEELQRKDGELERMALDYAQMILRTVSLNAPPRLFKDFTGSVVKHLSPATFVMLLRQKWDSRLQFLFPVDEYPWEKYCESWNEQIVASWPGCEDILS